MRIWLSCQDFDEPCCSSCHEDAEYSAEGNGNYWLGGLPGNVPTEYKGHEVDGEVCCRTGEAVSKYTPAEIAEVLDKKLAHLED
jgi:hypothetical protein